MFSRQLGILTGYIGSGIVDIVEFTEFEVTDERGCIQKNFKN